MFKNLELAADKEWSYRTLAEKVQNLVEYWKTTFNWRKIDSDINAKLPQFTTPIDAEHSHGSLTIHFMHKHSANPNAIPFIFVHRWPGNYLEVFIHIARAEELELVIRRKVAKLIDPPTNSSDAKHPASHVAPSQADSSAQLPAHAHDTQRLATSLRIF